MTALGDALVEALGWLWGPGRRRGWRRRVVRRLVSAVCAAGAVAGVLAAVHARPGGPTVPVVVAARSLAAGEVAVAGSVQVVRWPVALLPEGAARAVTEVVGRTLAAPLARGEPVTLARLATNSLLRGQPAGTMAVHVALSDTGSVAMVGPGDSVDLLGPSGAIAHALVVLRVDARSRGSGTALPTEGSLAGPGDGTSGIVVGASAAQAEAISRAPADSLGRPELFLVLRSR